MKKKLFLFLLCLNVFAQTSEFLKPEVNEYRDQLNVFFETEDEKDLKILLQKFIPNIDEYFPEFINHMDEIRVDREDAKVKVKVLFSVDSLEFRVKEESKSKNGEFYAVSFEKETGLEFYVNEDSIWIDNIQGIVGKVKIPVLPNAVRVKKLRLETSNETLFVYATFVGGAVNVVLKIDIRNRKVIGIDFPKTIKNYLP